MAAVSALANHDLGMGVMQTHVIDSESSPFAANFPSLKESYGGKERESSNPSVKNGKDCAETKQNQNSEISLQDGQGADRVVEENSSLSVQGEIGSKDWRVLFPNPRTVSKITPMKFTPPVEVNGKLQVTAQTENLAAGVKKCENKVVGFFVGNRLSFAALELAVKKLWKFKKEVTIKLYNDVAFIFEFKDEEDRKLVLDTGSFRIGTKLFTVRPWTHFLESSISMIKSVPIWVMIFGVPLHMWDNDGLGLIASYLGKPMFADDCTLNQDRLAYARVCVEIDLDFSYPSSIPLLIDGKIALDLPVEYQWKPFKCDSCLTFGHSTKACSNSKKLKTRWTPKKVFKPLQTEVSKTVPSEVLERGIIGESTGVSDASGDKNSNSEIVEKSLKGGRDVSVTNVGVGACFNTTVEVTKEHVPRATTKEVSNISGETTENYKVSKATVGSCDTNKVCGMDVTAVEKVVISSESGKKAVAGNTSNKAMITSSSISPAIEVADKDKGGVWTEVKGKKKGNSPKKNPFMVYSDFTDESRFPINKVGAIERSSSARFRAPIEATTAIEEGATSTKVATTREYTCKVTDLECSDEEFERKNRFLSLEEKALKRQEIEMHRLQWNGQSGIKTGKGTESLGRGQRTQHRKTQYG